MLEIVKQEIIVYRFVCYIFSWEIIGLRRVNNNNNKKNAKVIGRPNLALLIIMIVLRRKIFVE